MKILRLLAITILLQAGLAACSLPTEGTDMPGGETTLPSQPTGDAPATSTPKPPTATPEPEAWFVNLQDGDTVAAGLYQENRLGMVSVQVGYTPGDEHSAQFLVLDADGMQVGRVKYDFLGQSSSTTFNWTAWHGNGEYRLDLYKVNYKGTILSSQTLRITVTGIPDDVPTVEERFETAYLETFGLQLTAPVFVHYMDSDPERSMWNQWISTLYIDDTFYNVYFYDESDVTGTAERSLVSGEYSICRPAGAYRMLVVIVDYGNTTINPEKVLEKLADAEEIANQRWSDYSASIGLAMPVMQIETMVVFLETPPAAGELLTTGQIKALTGEDPAEYDILAEVDLDLAMQTPRAHGSTAVALFGACQPAGPKKVNIIVGIDKADNITTQTSVLYDHELMHLLGWMHEYPNGGGSGLDQYPLNHWFPYRLYGWVDTDGDGVLEILSDQPYGMLP